ncbi:MAG: RNA polymerase sigma factor [Pirellulales bacterium]
MSSQEEFHSLLAAAREGSQPAVARLLDEFGPTVLRAIRRKLARQLRTRFDSLDFVQAVWGSLFADPRLLADIESPVSLARLLTAMAENKVIEQFRRQLQTKKRDMRRDQSLQGSAIFATDEVADRHPTPSHLVIAEERWEQLLAAVPSRHRPILYLRRDGMPQQEIAEKLKLSQRTVARVLSRLSQGQG